MSVSILMYDSMNQSLNGTSIHILDSNESIAAQTYLFVAIGVQCSVPTRCTVRTMSERWCITKNSWHFCTAADVVLKTVTRRLSVHFYESRIDSDKSAFPRYLISSSVHVLLSFLSTWHKMCFLCTRVIYIDSAFIDFDKLLPVHNCLTN